MSGKVANIPVLRAGLTERELLSVCAAFLSLKDSSSSTIDWVKFAEFAGYSNSQSGRICFRSAQKKLKAFHDSELGNPSETGQAMYSQAGSSPSGTPKTSKSTKTTPRTPGSRRRGRPRKRTIDEATSVGGTVRDGMTGTMEEAKKMIKLESEYESKAENDHPGRIVADFGSSVEMLAETPTKRAKVEVELASDDMDSATEHIDYFSQGPPTSADEDENSLNFGLTQPKSM